MSDYNNEDDILPDVESLAYSGQTRLGSFIESWANTALGFVVSVAASFVIFPLLGMQSSGLQNIGAVLAFTIISVIRNYIVRRFFNGRESTTRRVREALNADGK